jgi:tRNA threonylcarbamoyladenosine biosynthesis protein TsaB
MTAAMTTAMTTAMTNDGASRYLLAIETATTTARVALLDPAGARRAAREATADRHSSNLLRLCDEVLREAGVAPASLAAIACGAGPGSFTGLRVGLAVGKGLALPTGLPFILVSSLAALALDILTVEPDATAGACIDAGKGQVYVGFFRADRDALVEAISDEWVLRPEEIAGRAPPPPAAVTVAGNGAARYAEVIDRALRRIDVAGPSADSVGRLALLRFARGDLDDLAAAVPAYGRAPDITTPRRSG